MSKLSKIKDVAVTDVQQVKKVRKLIPTSVSTRIGRSTLVLSKHSPTLLFGAGVIGFGATVVLACRATLKLEEVLEETTFKTALAKEAKETKPGYSDADHKQDLAYIRIRSAYAITKLYAPAIVVGSLSVAALTGSHNILNKRNAGLTAAYAATEKAFNEYRERVRAEVGDEKEREYMHGVQERTVIEETPNGPKKKKVRTAGDASQYAVWFNNQTSRNWEPTAEYNMLFLRGVQNHANDKLNAQGWLLLNDVYHDLGFEKTSAGAVVGWVKDADLYDQGDGVVDFNIFHDDQMDRFRDYVMGTDGEILIDFNVDGLMFELIDEQKRLKKQRKQ